MLLFIRVFIFRILCQIRKFTYQFFKGDSKWPKGDSNRPKGDS